MIGSDRPRNERGQYERTVSDEEILAAVREHQPAGTAEVGNEIGLARQNADYHLRRLEEGGHVSKKKVGPALVWMLASSRVKA
jgi:predicted ArsR family transcriptional regulator